MVTIKVGNVNLLFVNMSESSVCKYIFFYYRRKCGTPLNSVNSFVMHNCYMCHMVSVSMWCNNQFYRLNTVCY